MIQKIILALLITMSLNGCTRDDICDPNTPTTPLLIITFKDSANPLEAKEVPNLTVETTGTNSIQVISQTTTDSISIPLNVNVDFAQYRFKKDDGGTSPNNDIVDFMYSREDIYVNRACAFKTVFDNLTANVQDEGTANWIVSFNILNETIENETQTHLTILH